MRLSSADKSISWQQFSSPPHRDWSRALSTNCRTTIMLLQLGERVFLPCPGERRRSCMPQLWGEWWVW
jgi:hypothetical protein